MSYYSITTDAGDAALAQYSITGTQVLFSQLAVGDGNGQSYDPAKTQTALRNEVWRGAAVVEMDPNDAKRVLITATIPAETGGFTIREAGVFTAAGVMLVVAKIPASEKTAPADGSTSDYVMRIYVRVDSASAVAITVDQSQIQATKQDLVEAIAPVTQSLAAHKTDETVHMTTLACTKSGTVYALTGLTATSGAVPVMFKASAAYIVGDTVTIDGTAYTLKTTDNTALTPAAWAVGAIVTGTVDVDAKTLTVNPSAPVGSVPITRTINGYDLSANRTLGAPDVKAIGIATTFIASGAAILDWANELTGCGEIGQVQPNYASDAPEAHEGLYICENVGNASRKIVTFKSYNSYGMVYQRRIFNAAWNGGWYIVGQGSAAATAATSDNSVAIGTPGLRNVQASSAQASSYLGLGVINVVIS